ncbi:unnamed protein product [Ceutorhynchus assimilis]|uniref:Uncharacterized protein n=1 Tax=Ceutorhynchus assimilis TaxID=467358 RepID=A0A9N9MQC4_9CUCU|nr:unnamed protein product [Ceutorhynchus assimilis]
METQLLSDIDEKSKEVVSEIAKKDKKTTTNKEKAVDFCVPKLSPRDSIHPSYSNLQLPYRIVCRHRLHASKNHMKKEIHRELRHIELDQSKALDGVRIHRIFSDNEIQVNKEEILELTSKQKRRLEELLAAP